MAVCSCQKYIERLTISLEQLVRQEICCDYVMQPKIGLIHNDLKYRFALGSSTYLDFSHYFKDVGPRGLCNSLFIFLVHVTFIRPQP